MRRTRLSLAIAKTGLIAAIAALTACDRGSGEYDTTPPLIEPAPPSNVANLCAPTPASQSTVSETVYYKYSSGKNWTAAESGTRNNLFGVWGAVQSDLWAAGMAGALLRAQK